MYVPLSLVRPRYSTTLAGIGWPGMPNSSSTSASVDGPVLVLRITGRPNLAEKNLGSCLGELMFEGSAHSLVNLVFEGRDGPGDLVAQLAEKVAQSRRIPQHSMRARTGTSGSSTSR